MTTDTPAPLLTPLIAVLVSWLLVRAGQALGAEAARRWRNRTPGQAARRLLERSFAALLGLCVGTTAPPVSAASVAVTTGADEPAPVPVTMRPLTPRPAPITPTAEPADQTWVIAAGDHLWGLSRSALEDALRHVPTDREIAAYVTEVIERNRHVFVVAGDPDLVVPGQVFVRPPLPGA